MLRESKKISNKEIAESLDVPITMVEHWFRTDASFSIPSAEIWFKLKNLLNITTDEFDLPITEFIEKDNVFDTANRIYDSKGVSPTLTAVNSSPSIVAPFASVDRVESRMNGRRFKEPGDPSFTLTGMDAHGIIMWDGRHKVNTLRASIIFELMYKGKAIRRLTEVECERLQGFPDNWTQGISMTQRYRSLGNAVTVNVITAIANKLQGLINENER